MSFSERELHPQIGALRLIVAILLILPVCAVLLTSGAAAITLTVAMWPFACLRNTAGTILEALLQELWGPRP